jgi:hypothetical protein
VPKSGFLALPPRPNVSSTARYPHLAKDTLLAAIWAGAKKQATALPSGLRALNPRLVCEMKIPRLFSAGLWRSGGKRMLPT